MSDNQQPTGLELLLMPFPEEHISHLPKPTCKAEIYKKLDKGHCSICGGYHAKTKTVHLAFVGHAALTLRLLESDIKWQWEPQARDEHGLPRFDTSGGLWIYLTVCGVTRPGYGHAKDNPYAEIGSRTKEVIGDALRNAAMRFGAALDLWSKADLTKVVDDEPGDDKPEPIPVVKWQEGIESFFEKGFTVAKLDKWLSDKEADMAMLSKTDQHKVKVCIRETRAAITENLAKPPETVKCPESGREAVKADCLQSECHKTCEAMGNSSKNNQEINIDE